MESPFSHRFNTNYVPSDEEIACIRNDLVLHTRELERIDERIHELPSQRDQLQAYVDHHRALISHPRRLPPDIVREIFVGCLPTNRNAVMSAQEAPLLLCRISSAWRTIALSTPRLWASLHISFRHILSNEPRMQAVAKWLALSAACPISLSVVYAEDHWTDWGQSSAAALLKCLADSSARWRHVEFTSLTRTCPEVLAAIIPPALESFKFAGSVWALTQLKVFQASSPRALSLLLSEFGEEPLGEVVLTLPLAWDRLTHLNFQSLGGFSIPSLVTLLRRCTHLISFNVAPRLDYDEIDLPTEPISLPFLETFILRQPGSLTHHAVSWLIELVSMPQLRQFDVSTLASQGGDSYFLVPLGTKSPRLENLTIHLKSFTAQSLPETLRSFSSLTKLVVYDTGNTHDGWSNDLQDPFQPCDIEQLLSLLTPNAETAVVCPALQELIFTTVFVQKPTLDAFVEGRLQSTPCFRRLEMMYKNSWALKLMSKAEIQTYLSRDLDIILVHGSTWGELPAASPWTGLVDEEDWSVG
ncbi:hypothetical protein MVEN_01217000 [Mycena venus]|uniref:F-box domain-containing protein n=1 Tax=Mycena venus TaxID=2733690 RepID=A0A8H6Y6G5_9AGAR|nr:hypothetical protein MVEN_01217000 [Mycena venus]